MTRPSAPFFGFTEEQRRSYESLVPSVPEAAVRKVVHEYAAPKDRLADLSQEAYIGVALAVCSYDPALGELRSWAYHHAYYAARAVMRREERHADLAKRVREGLTANGMRHHAVPDPVTSSDKRDRTAWTDFRDRSAASAFTSAGVFEPPREQEGEDAVIQREMAARCADALDEAVGGLSPARRELLRLFFAKGVNVKDLAAQRGKKGYRRELVEFHRVVDITAARMRGKGFHELPPFPEEAAGTILSEEAPASRPGEE